MQTSCDAVFAKALNSEKYQWLTSDKPAEDLAQEKEEKERKMKMVVRAEGSAQGGQGNLSTVNRTVVVGVKLDQPSKELLTWVFVKVAQPGDRVVALHVLDPDELVDQEGQSSLLSLVKAFDTVLAVYEGFCNLKQVDLKLKVCRGSSVKKVLVKEAKAFAACKVILGVAKTSRPIGFSASIAKYCSRKLPRECYVLAVNNGKVVYQGAGLPNSPGNFKWDRQVASGLFGVFHRSLSKNCKSSNIKLLEYPSANTNWKNGDQEIEDNSLRNSDATSGLNEDLVTRQPPKKKCSICSRFSVLSEDALCHDPPEPDRPSCDEPTVVDATDFDNSLALVPVQVPEAATSSASLLVKEVPEARPGWPLLRRAFLPERKIQEKRTGRRILIVQWALRLPSRQHSAAAIHPDHKSVKVKDPTATSLDGESGAMVLVGDPASPTSKVIISEEPKTIPKELESLHAKYSATCRLFDYQELVYATSNFSAENLIGKGGTSRVYRGRLPDGKELAVKILKPSEDVVHEFVLEIEIITTVTHKNIIALFGFCFEDSNLLLVYDLLSRGSLEENLHGKKNKLVLGWEERYKVALGVAEALDYLHSRSDKPVIHRDVKSSNVLLSDDFEPQLSDFGLAKWASASSGHITCGDVAGTFGYLAPEYFMYGKVTDKIDVYAFGVVLLELLSGRKPISNEHPKGQESLVMWAKPILSSGKYMQLLDPLLGDLFDKDQMDKMVMAASLCIRRAPRFRPRMGTILKLLQGDKEVTKWAKLQVNSSEELDMIDEDSFPSSNVQSYLTLAMLDVEDDALSVSSTEPSGHYLTANKSLEDYLQGRWSRSSSFD